MHYNDSVQSHRIFFSPTGGKRPERRLTAPPGTVLNGEKGYALETSPIFPCLAAKQFTGGWHITSLSVQENHREWGWMQ